MSMLKGLSSLCTTANFSVKHSLKSLVNPDVAIFNKPHHPLYKRTRERFELRKHELLVYTIVPKATVSKLACVRQRCKRRTVEAIRQALHERGYDINGKSCTKEKDAINGTLIFFPRFAVVNAQWEQLLKDAAMVLDRFLWKRKEKSSIGTNMTMSRRGASHQPSAPKPGGYKWRSKS
ncbi:hypothetical protein EDC01DRAFT_628678 [Geopyxis carbonaria]|nr:hypothetical protein EDC01DRAFT_628678 [Geopyxis carbonaria]